MAVVSLILYTLLCYALAHLAYLNSPYDSLNLLKVYTRCVNHQTRPASVTRPAPVSLDIEHLQQLQRGFRIQTEYQRPSFPWYEAMDRAALTTDEDTLYGRFSLAESSELLNARHRESQSTECASSMAVAPTQLPNRYTFLFNSIVFRNKHELMGPGEISLLLLPTHSELSIFIFRTSERCTAHAPRVQWQILNAMTMVDMDDPIIRQLIHQITCNAILLLPTKFRDACIWSIKGIRDVQRTLGVSVPNPLDPLPETPETPPVFETPQLSECPDCGGDVGRIGSDHFCKDCDWDTLKLLTHTE